MSIAVIRLTPWVDQTMHFRDFKALEPDHKEGTLIDGTLRVSTKYTNQDGWWLFGHEVVIPELIAHYSGLNITFITPGSDFNGTFGEVKDGKLTGPLSWLRNDKIDYLLDGLYLSEEIWYPEIVSVSLPTTDYYPMAIATKKEHVMKTVNQLFSAFGYEFWLLLFISLILVSQLVHALWKKNNLKNGSINESIARSISSQGYFNLLWDLFNLLLKQSNKRVKNMPRHIISHIWFYSTIIFTTLFIGRLYDGMMFVPQEWCDSIECFASSPKSSFTGSHSPAIEVMRHRHPDNKAFKKLLEKSIIKSKNDIEINLLFDFLSGRTDVIFDSQLMNKFFNMKNLYRPLNGDSYIMAAKYDNSLEVVIIRTGHPKKNQILRIIARCVEHGIILKWDQLDGHLLALAIINLLFKFASDEMVRKIVDIVDYKKTMITIEDYHGLLVVFYIGVLIAILVLLIEKAIHN